MKTIIGPAHPIHIPCPDCGAAAGVDCPVIRNGWRCPGRERANADRLNKLAEERYGKPTTNPAPAGGE